VRLIRFGVDRIKIFHSKVFKGFGGPVVIDIDDYAAEVEDYVSYMHGSSIFKVQSLDS
jgi:hypothetical protein